MLVGIWEFSDIIEMWRFFGRVFGKLLRIQLVYYFIFRIVIEGNILNGGEVVCIEIQV